MATGITWAPDVFTAYQGLKTKSGSNWLVVKINFQTNVTEVEAEGHDADTIKAAVAKLPNDDCRYAIVDYSGKVFFILYSPENTNVKSRMIYATSFTHLSSELGGGHKKFEAHAKNAITAELLDKVA